MRVVKPLFLIASLFILSVISAHSQAPVKKYASAWKKVEEHIQKGLPQSALTEVKKIYELAKKEKQDAQVIRTLVYMTGLQEQIREYNYALSITEIEKEIAVNKEPAVSILKSILAEKYLSYYYNHRWQLLDRTQTTAFKKEDIATWGAEDLHKKISEIFLQSIQNTKLLQQTRLDAFDDVIMKGNMRHLRPTLFDLLGHRAIDYFQSDERDVQRPAYAFEIDQASAFDPAADFVTRKFPTRDSLSLHHKALLIFQELLAFHLRDTKPDALIDADIRRIEFAKDHSTHPEKDKLYVNAITQITRQYANQPAAAQAWYLLAAYHEQKASTYTPYGDTTYRYSRLKAKEICDRIIQQKDSSEGKINCQNLLYDINRRELHFDIEKVNVIGQPMRALVRYRSFTLLHLRVIRVTDELRKALERPYEETYWAQATAATALKSWQQSLPATNDMQQHTVEIKIDGLPTGEYMLLSSPDKDMAAKASIVGARAFIVSNISYINNGSDHFVLHRDNGQPLTNAAIQVWEQKYDYTTSKYITQKGGLYRTDANGYAKVGVLNPDIQRNTNNTYKLEITHDKDKLHMSDWINSYYYRDNVPNQNPETITNTFLFTDRSIYRPGQTIYFKGISLLKNAKDRTASVSAGYTTTLYLKDANYQDIDSIRVTTNEFGSFSGKFQLPATGLNGRFQLLIKPGTGNTSFRVEEYKRPKFYVDYEPIKGTYRVNDKIAVTGLAKAYAGNNIDGATVKYRVVRQPRFLYPWMFRRWWQPPAQPMEIAHGEVKTDKNGKFIINFTAIPDLTIDKKLEPVFDYHIYADVTDINGETRSGEQSVSVSYKALLLKTNVPDRLPSDSLQSLWIRTENMNGQYEPAVVKVIFAKLKEEKRLIRARYWVRPDQFVMSKQEYIGYFPNDEYDNESEYRSWDKERTIFTKSDSARENGKWNMNGDKLAPGFYQVEISTKDRNGEEVKDIQYIELYDEKANKLGKPAYVWFEAAKPVEPGKTTSAKLGTSAENIFVIRQTDRSTTGNKESNTYSFISLNDEKRSFDFTPTEADRGGYGAGWVFIKNNRFYHYWQTISVPWTNKELSIEYATYRDKTLPGSEERWKVKITGYKKEAAAAEMLASMYDASLDQFSPHNWNQPSVWPYYAQRLVWNQSTNFAAIQSILKPFPHRQVKYVDKRYDVLVTDYGQGSYNPYGRGRKNGGYDYKTSNRMPLAFDAVSAPKEGARGEELAGAHVIRREVRKDGTIADEMLEQLAVPPPPPQQPAPIDNLPVQVRKNFNETAFFFPDLRTDSSGAIEFSFTMPEALTKWKFMALAHTKDAAFGSSTTEIITQKQLMVQPNMPRFLREGDKMEFSSKIVNLSEKELTGQAELQLIDATTNTPVDGWFKNAIPNQYFTVAPGQSEAVKFPIEVPYLFNKALVWRIVARAGEFSDGEESVLPVLTNRLLVTETLPLNVRGAGTKEFKFDKLLNSQQSETLKHHALTVEYTSNPAWYAVQALPYLMEYPYECAEQNWNRYYANSLASYIVNASPRIQQVFEQWKINDTAALMSNLQKNQELKAVLLEETPWVLQAKNEAQQKKNIALLFDMVKMSRELHSTFEKLKQMQSSNGGFVWFKGGPDDRYITQYIVTGIGHLKKLNAWAKGQDDNLRNMLATAIPYLDRKIKEEYDELVKYKTDLKKYTPGYTAIQYLYMRSFFPEMKIPAASMVAYNYFRERAQQTWLQHNKYMQGMIVLALGRTGDAATPAAILRSLKETSINNEELGMYWKDAARSWWWYEAPIERQALLIEAFQEIGKDTKTVDDLRTWLLKNKQTNNWNTTKATAEACYALLLQGTEWLTSEPVVAIKLGNTTVSSSDNKQEAGTGYFKKIIEEEKITPQMGNISVKVESLGEASTTWGAVYWQYFEDLDKITTSATPLKLVKKLFVEKNTDRGPVLTPVNDGDILKVGDKIRVRVELRVDRDMEYVHMKDMRASALEPVNVLSSYKWQGGLGYYESTRDASTNFFFSYLRKGTYVFEYPLFVTHTGNFSNGITSIQCMYAPEFSSHSEGIRINVE